MKTTKAPRFNLVSAPGWDEDALVTQARACGLDLDGHPEVYPLGQGQQNGRA